MGDSEVARKERDAKEKGKVFTGRARLEPASRKSI